MFWLTMFWACTGSVSPNTDRRQQASDKTTEVVQPVVVTKEKDAVHNTGDSNQVDITKPEKMVNQPVSQDSEEQGSAAIPAVPSQPTELPDIGQKTIVDEVPKPREKESVADTKATKSQSPKANSSSEPKSEVKSAPEPNLEPKPEPKATTSQYSVGSHNSSLSVRVYKDPKAIGAKVSHNHIMVASGWSGKISWHPNDASKCKINIQLPVAKLVVDSPGARKRAGLKGEISKKQRNSIKKNMLSKKQLHGSAYPTIRFVSSSCDATSGRVNVKGTFTMRGKSKRLIIPMKVKLQPKFSATASFSIRATDFGFQPYSGLMGAVKNKNTMKIKARFSP